MSDNREAWFSTGIAAADRAYYSHKARLECITNAIDAMGKLRNTYGFAIDSLPADVNAARDALWKAYHAELARKPAAVPKCDQVGV